MSSKEEKNNLKNNLNIFEYFNNNKSYNNLNTELNKINIHNFLFFKRLDYYYIWYEENYEYLLHLYKNVIKPINNKISFTDFCDFSYNYF